mmetsp:Transcript_12338/g.29404  ORF Transcript_12338/g.29404 Transcript_12338/m.29404 type:complete len:312 (+) Transcript_12338:847-1782(+)
MHILHLFHHEQELAEANGTVRRAAVPLEDATEQLVLHLLEAGILPALQGDLLPTSLRQGGESVKVACGTVDLCGWDFGEESPQDLRMLVQAGMERLLNDLQGLAPTPHLAGTPSVPVTGEVGFLLEAHEAEVLPTVHGAVVVVIHLVQELLDLIEAALMADVAQQVVHLQIRHLLVLIAEGVEVRGKLLELLAGEPMLSSGFHDQRVHHVEMNALLPLGSQDLEELLQLCFEQRKAHAPADLGRLYHRDLPILIAVHLVNTFSERFHHYPPQPSCYDQELKKAQRALLQRQLGNLPDDGTEMLGTVDRLQR